MSSRSSSPKSKSDYLQNTSININGVSHQSSVSPSNSSQQLQSQSNSNTKTKRHFGRTLMQLQYSPPPQHMINNSNHHTWREPAVSPSLEVVKMQLERQRTNQRQ